MANSFLALQIEETPDRAGVSNIKQFEAFG
jgi:hypothetical protein